MVLDFAEAILDRLKALGALVSQWGVWLVVAAALVAILLLGLYAVDRQAYGNLMPRLRRSLLQAGAWGLLAAGLWFCGSLLLDLRDIHVESLNAQDSSSIVSSEDPEVPQIFQYGPAAGYLQEKTYTRRLILPPSFLERIGADGVQVLSPYLQDPTAENVLELVDTFRKSGQDVVFTRDIKKLEETPLRVKDADVRVDLDFLSQGQAERRSTYRSRFSGRYTFANPLETKAPVRFTFAPPQSGTSIQGFKLKVLGQEVTEPNEQGSYVWENEVAGGGEVVAEVEYESLGSARWSYDVGSGRRRIEHFKLELESDRPASFSRTALFPTTRNGNHLTWDLEDVITSQQIHVAFPRAASMEILSQAWTLFPFGLLLFVAIAIWIHWRLRLALSPLKLLLLVALMAIGFGATAILSGVASMALSLNLSCILAARFGSLGLRKGLLAGVPAALLPLTALSPVYTGLWMLGLLTVTAAAVLILTRPGTSVQMA